MANVGDLVVKLRADSKQLDSSLDDAESRLKRTGGKMKGIGKAMTMGVTAPIVGIGLNAIMTGANFEKGMNRVKALTGTTGDQFDALKQQAKDLGSSTAFSATEAGDAMGFLAMAGFKSKDILTAMPGVLNLAAAAQMDLGQAADITSNILTGFGKDTEELGQVNDVLVKAMTSANVDLSMLGESMKYIGPVASSAGMDFEETAAAIALLGNAGIQGSMAGTTLRGVMTRLMTPTTEAAGIMRKLGISVMDSEGNLKGFTEITRQMEDAGIKTADAMAIFGARAGPGMMALVSQGSDALEDLTGELKNSGGTAERIASTQLEGMSGAIVEMKSAFEGLMIALSEDVLPIFTMLIDKITPILQKFTSMPGPVKAIIVVVGLLAAILGPLLIILGLMLPGIAALGPAFAFMSGGMVISTVSTWAQAAASTALSIAMGPVTLAVIAIAAAVAAGILIWKNWDKIVAVFWGSLDKLKEVFSNVINAVTDIFNSKWGWLLPGGALIKGIQKLKTNWREIWDAILTKFSDIWDSIKAVATAIIEPFKEIFKKIKAAFDFGAWAESLKENFKNSIYMEWLTGLQDKWTEIWDGIKTKFEEIWNAIKEFGGTLWDGIKTAWDLVWDPISTGWTILWDGIKSKFETVWNAIKTFAGTLWDGITTAWNLVWDPIKTGWTLLWDGMKTKFEEVWGKVKTFLSTTLDGIKTKWDTVWEGMKGIVVNIANPIIGAINAIIGAINSLFGALNGIHIGWDKQVLRGVPDIPGFSFTPFSIGMIPEIPKLAKGGIVTKPTLAMIGENGAEAVIPLGRGGGGGSNIVINITGPTYGFDDFERKVSQAIRDGVRRGGYQGIIAPARG